MNRVLVIRFSALGDVAMLAPIVRAAAEQHPDVSFTMLSQQRFADLFAAMPPNVTFRGADLKKQSLHDIISELGTYDLVADMHSVLRSLYIRTAMRLRGAKVAIIDKGRRDKWHLTRGHHAPLRHNTLRYADVFAELGLTILLPEPVHSPGEGIGIAPFAAHAGKIYPLERMESVVAQLSGQGIPITLFGGGHKEQEILGAWANRYPGVTSVAGKHSLAEELGIMRGLRLMLTMDSGNMHLASLVGTRVLSIWGATHPYAGFLGFGQSELDCIQRDLNCRPCSVYGNKKCRLGDYRCMDIDPTSIVERVRQAYNE